MVVCLVRDGAYFVEKFIEYYKALGASQIVFVDNGSTDATIELAAKHPDLVTVVGCDLSAKEYESEMRRYAALSFARNSWCLFADIDELFLNPAAPAGSMESVLRYLDREGFTAVVAHLIDLYPTIGFTDRPNQLFSEAVENYRYLESSSMEWTDYHDERRIGFSYFLRDNDVPGQSIRFAFGGVRKRVFDVDVCLTKHPLVSVTDPVVPSVHPHVSRYVKCADFTAAILHYKFAGDFVQRTKRDVAERRWDHGETATYIAQPLSSASQFFNKGDSYELIDAKDLREKGVLVASDRFLASAVD